LTLPPWSHCLTTFILAYLLVKVPRPGDSIGTFSVFQAATYYYQSNHLKVETIPLSALSKDTTSILSGLTLRYLFNAERQAGK